jgi:quinol monooxygenase YgiN
MSVYTIWESAFPADRHEEGTEVTRAIWRDMRGFAGYLGHEIVEDLEQPGHLIVFGRWASQAAADDALHYRSSPTAQRADELVCAPRRRTVGRVIDTGTTT